MRAFALCLALFCSALFSLPPSPALAVVPATPKLYMVKDSKAGVNGLFALYTQDECAILARQAQEADYVMLAGNHWNSTDRNARLELLEGILQEAARRGLKPAIGLQTLSAELQGPLDRFNRGETSAAEFRQVAVSQEKQGLPPELEQILTLAEKYKTPLYGLNVPRRLADVVSQEGAGHFYRDGFNPEDRAFLPQRLLPVDGVLKSRLVEIYNAHPHAAYMREIKQKGLKNFLFMQSFWDSAIAENCCKIKENRQVTGPLLIWGGTLRLGHGYGVSRGLATDNAPVSLLVVHPLPDNGLPVVEWDAANYYYPSKAEPMAAHMPFTVERRAVLSIPAPEDAMLTVEERSGIHPVWPGVNTSLVITAVVSEPGAKAAQSNAAKAAQSNAVEAAGPDKTGSNVGANTVTARLNSAWASHNAADVSGLKPGDVLISVDNEEMREAEDLENVFISRLATPRALDRPVFVVWRKGEGLLRVQNGVVSKAAK